LKERIAHRHLERRLRDKEGAGAARTLACLILLWAAFSRPSYAFQLSAEEILTKVSETYRSLRSYQVVALENDELASVGESRSSTGVAFSNFHKSRQIRVELAAVMPGKVRRVVENERLYFVLVSDGQTTWTYMPKQKQFSEAMWNPSQAPDASRPDEKAEERILSQYWKLLVGRLASA
jgi:outer membrane lipoprotein-sorting protein